MSLTTPASSTSAPITAPASTYVLVVGVMATFTAFGIVLSFTPVAWYYYMIPVAIAIPAVVVLVQRWQARRLMRRQLHEEVQQLT